MKLSVLGCDVSDGLLAAWETYYAPGVQPFPRPLLPDDIALAPEPAASLADELRDTFFLYGGGPWAWLDEATFLALEPERRHALQRDCARRMGPKPTPAWPSDPLLRSHLVRWVEAGTRSSQHALAETELRRASRSVLPRAKELAGTFAPTSGFNCFAAVMAAAGERVDGEWVQLDQFQAWLGAAAEPSTDRSADREAGQVLVWRERGDLAHAAVTIAGGWVLQKPSQSWSSPVVVQPIAEVVNSWRLPEVRLSRFRLRA